MTILMIKYYENGSHTKENLDRYLFKNHEPFIFEKERNGIPTSVGDLFRRENNLICVVILLNTRMIIRRREEYVYDR